MTISKQNDRMPPGQHLVAQGKWPTIGERLPRESNEPWSLSIDGKVKERKTFVLSELSDLPQTEMTCDIHCVTRWSKFDVSFTGVLLADLMGICGAQSNSQFVSFIARNARSHSTSLKLEDVLELKTLIALKVDGEPLPLEKGGPIRSIVPGRYFYKSVKWVERIELLEMDSLGYWEKDAGYHNHADPWLEERYISATVDKRCAKELIDSRDFVGQDLLSIQLADYELTGLKAQRASLRNANFSNCKLVGADFSEANLSNAEFAGADLREVDFTATDLEGANLAGANLCGAKMNRCSLFGSTFCDENGSDVDQGRIEFGRGAIFDSRTVLNDESIAVLTPLQQHYVRSHLAKVR